jgi:hypothetical protein
MHLPLSNCLLTVYCEISYKFTALVYHFARPVCLLSEVNIEPILTRHQEDQNHDVLSRGRDEIRVVERDTVERDTHIMHN